MKKCWKCQIEKDVTEFFKDRSKSDGLNGKCKTCQMAYFNQYIQKNAERFKKLKAEWYRRKRETS